MSKRSRETFLKQIKTGKIQTNQMKVYDVLSKASAYNLDHLRDIFSGNQDMEYMPHQTLTATLSALCDMGVVMQNQSNGYFFTVPIEHWDDCARQREDQAYRRWQARGEKKGWFHRAYIDKMVDDELQMRLWEK